MSEQSTVILDNYYSNPDEIRNLALSLNYSQKEGAQYPGMEAYSDIRDWESVRQDLMKSIDKNDEECIPEVKKKFLHGKFRLALEKDKTSRPDGVHQDMQRYSGIIYLSRNRDLTGGVGLFKCKYTGETSISSKGQWLRMIEEKYKVSPGTHEYLNKVRQHMKDFTNWEQIGELPMRYNRAIILMAHCFHASSGIFGSDKYTGRLTQHFEFYL